MVNKKINKNNSKKIIKKNKTHSKKTNKEKNIKNSTKKSWLEKKVFILLTIIFIISQSIGLFVAQKLISLNIKSSPITGNMNNPLEAIYLIFLILLMTSFIIILIKYKKQRKFLWVFEIIAVFSTSIIVFGSFIPDDFIVLILTFLLIIFRLKNKENLWIRNTCSIIAISGAGALIGISIGVFPVLLFITLLSIYDFIAVFKTKHMVELGESVTKQNLAFTIAMPTKKHKFELGNGDLVIPLVTATSILANGFFTNNFLVAMLCLIGSYIGLFFSIYIVGTKKIPLPALPPQTILILIIIGISFLIRL